MRLEMRVRGWKSEQWKIAVDETATTVCKVTSLLTLFRRMILSDGVEKLISEGVVSAHCTVDRVYTHHETSQLIESLTLSSPSTSSHSTVICRRMILIHDVSRFAGGMSVLLECISHPYCCVTGDFLITDHRSREDSPVTSLDLPVECCHVILTSLCGKGSRNISM